jgi:hypothetical protein
LEEDDDACEKQKEFGDLHMVCEIGNWLEKLPSLLQQPRKPTPPGRTTTR